MDTAKVLTYENTTKYSPQMFSLYLACSRFNGKKPPVVMPGIRHRGFHWKTSGEEIGRRWRRAPRIDLRPQGPCTCPNPAERSDGSAGAPTSPPNLSTKPPRGAAAPEQQRGDGAATAKPCLSCNYKAKAPRIF